MVEPGTAAIAVLSTIAGISGYGAMKINSKQGEMIESEIQKRIKATQDLLNATQAARASAEADLHKQATEVKRLTDELAAIKTAKETLEKEKAGLKSSLQSATEGEQLFKSVPLPVLKQAIKDFKNNDEVIAAQEGLTPVEQLNVMNVFDKIESITALSFSRGTLQSLYQGLTKATGKQEGFMPRDRFDRIFTDALKGADANLAAAKRAQEEETEAKKRADAEAAEKKKADAAEEAAKKKAEEEAAKKKADEDAQTKEADERLARLEALMQPPPFNSAEELQTWFRTEWIPASPEDRKLLEPKRKRALEFLQSVIPESRRAEIDARRQKGGAETDLEDMYRQLTGASRKSTLKKRREGKQNGRGTRRGKNRTNRTHSNSR